MVQVIDSLRSIADKLDLSKLGVERVINKYTRTGEVKNIWNSNGRPKKLDDRDIRNITRNIERNPFVTRAELVNNLNLNIHESTISRVLKAEGYVLQRVSKKKLLTAEMKAVRLQWAKKFLNWTLEEWETVIFSDESKFTTGYHDRSRTYRKKKERSSLDEKFLENSEKDSTQRIMLWGAFGIWDLSDIIFVEGKMDARLYTEALRVDYLAYIRNHNIDLEGVQILEDNDRKH